MFLQVECKTMLSVILFLAANFPFYLFWDFVLYIAKLRSSVHVSGKEQVMKTRKHDIALISSLLLGNK